MSLKLSTRYIVYLVSIYIPGINTWYQMLEFKYSYYVQVQASCHGKLPGLIPVNGHLQMAARGAFDNVRMPYDARLSNVVWRTTTKECRAHIVRVYPTPQDDGFPRQLSIPVMHRETHER